MKKRIERTQHLVSEFSSKEVRKYSLDVYLRLLEKLKEEDITDKKINNLVHVSEKALREILNGSKSTKKDYHKTYKKLLEVVKEKHNLVPRNSIKNQYMALGIAVGLALGSAFIVINPGLIAIGLPIGLAIGLSIGEKKEQELKEEGKLF
ncbi:MAG: hypothetical protein K9L74_00175 [Candidatus Izimaplasma sp.]|nr:hypothetical protein [Candidatus Izimaplasma bacterium]